MVPHKVHDGAHISGAGCDVQHSILFGKYNTILSEGSIAAVKIMTAPPELIPIALLPITVWTVAIGGLFFCSFFYPSRRDKLFSLPHTFLQIKLPQVCNIFCAHL